MRLDYQLDDQDNEKGVCCIVYSVFIIFCNPKNPYPNTITTNVGWIKINR